MKRSEVDRYIDEAKEFFVENKFFLPEWAEWTPEIWKTKGPECNEIRFNELGWDVTDFGSGRFEKEGLILVTIRNGNVKHDNKTYCEKIMMVRENQMTPTHFHWKKMEDIINRGGGNLCIKLWQADPETEQMTGEEVVIKIDGIMKSFKPGEVVRLRPGQSICFEPYIYHTFWSENGPAMVGEVSTVNNDTNDNNFFEKTERYVSIEEDVPARYMLCNEYFN